VSHQDQSARRWMDRERSARMAGNPNRTLAEKSSLICLRDHSAQGLGHGAQRDGHGSRITVLKHCLNVGGDFRLVSQVLRRVEWAGFFLRAFQTFQDVWAISISFPLAIACDGLYLPRTHLARSTRSISKGFIQVIPRPMHAFGILIFFTELAGTSCVTTVYPAASACATR
jgi:hypothetical protein